MTPETPQDTDLPEPRPRRSWGLRFSLLTMVLLVTVAALAISHWRMSAELAKKNQRVEQLHESLGIPPVTDPAKVTAVGVPLMEEHRPYDHYRWQWHLIIPEGKEYELFVAINEVPRTGLPEKPIHVKTVHDSEVRIHLAIDRMRGFAPTVMVRGKYVLPRLEAETWFGKPLSTSEAEWLKTFDDYSNDKTLIYHLDGAKPDDPPKLIRTQSEGRVPEGYDKLFEPKTYKPSETIILRRTRHFEMKDWKDDIGPDVCPGIMLWLEPKKQESKPTAS